MLAFEHVGHAAESGLRHHRRGHTVARAHAGEVEGFLDVLEIAFPAPHARDLLDGIRQDVPHGLLIQAGHRRGGSGGADGGAHAFGAAMRRAHVIGAEREQPPATQVVAECDRANELGTRPILPFADRERGRDRGTTRVRFRDGLEVVGLVRVGEHRVHERRVDRGRPEVGRENRGFRRAALRPREPDRHLAWLEPRAGDHGRNRVEDAVLGVPYDIGRQRLLACRGHVARNAPGEIRRTRAGGRGALCLWLCRLETAGERGSSQERRAAFEHAPARDDAGGLFHPARMLARGVFMPLSR